MTAATSSARMRSVGAPIRGRSSARAAAKRRAEAFKTAVEESLGLFLVGGVCLVLAAYYISNGARFGGSRLPVWELFLALGIVGMVGGFLSLAAEDEPSGGAPRTVGRPFPHVTFPSSDLPRSTEKREFSDEPEIDDFRGISGAIEVPESDLTVAGVPTGRLDGDVRTSVEDALAELDGVERSLSEGPRARPMRSSEFPATAVHIPASDDASNSGASPPRMTGFSPEISAVGGPTSGRAPPGECGGCGRLEVGSEGVECPGCGSLLCAACWAGLEPPPCPGCVVIQPRRMGETTLDSAPEVRAKAYSEPSPR